MEKKLDYRADGIDKAIHSVTYTDLENLRMAFVFRNGRPLRASPEGNCAT